MPAIYKLLERLSQMPDVEFKLVLLSREADPQFDRERLITIRPFGIDALILPWRAPLPNIVNEFLQTLRVLKLFRAWRPQVGYVTNAGFVSASLAARLGLAPIVLRFLGIFPIHKDLAAGRRPLARWLYRAPFAHAVCSQDGSGGEYFLAQLLNRKVPLSVLLNGVDLAPPRSDDVETLRSRFHLDARPVIGFVGRLVDYKGADEFIFALERLDALRPQAFQALLVGAGPLQAELANRISRSSLAGRVHFAGAVAHNDVAAHLAACDIYVSLNRNGGLSNSNLEALASGKCMLMLDKDAKSHTDVATEHFVPADVVQRLPRTGTANALASTLADLIDRPEEVALRAARTTVFAREQLQGWENRIAHEIDILYNAARPSALAPQAAS